MQRRKVLALDRASGADAALAAPGARLRLRRPAIRHRVWHPATGYAGGVPAPDGPVADDVFPWRMFRHPRNVAEDITPATCPLVFPLS
jgi:hypothetical protein